MALSVSAPADVRRTYPTLIPPPPLPALPFIDGRSKPLSTGDAAAALGMSPRTLRAQLLAAPKDAAGSRIVEGEWAGCYRRGIHWRVPVMVVRRRQQTLEAQRVMTQRQAASTASSEVERELRRLIAQNTADIARIREALAATFRTLYQQEDWPKQVPLP